MEREGVINCGGGGGVCGEGMRDGEWMGKWMRSEDQDKVREKGRKEGWMSGMSLVKKEVRS